MGLRTGLQVAWEKEFRRVDCFCDSNTAIHLIMVDDIQYHQYAATIMQIREFIDRDWVVKFQHILRERNNNADFLAEKRAQHNENLVTLNAPPQEMNSMLLADASRVAFLSK
ncbi:Ribonuclease H-like superfamily [Sesbania bispinosa]|nr:Ribonuclease H-like superfamily [Sesbania bispinosa]